MSCREFGDAKVTAGDQSFLLHRADGHATAAKRAVNVGSLEAGDRYATLLTLAVNCALCGANPFEYFRDLFDAIASGHPASRKDELMPRRWLAAKQAGQKTTPNLPAI